MYKLIRPLLFKFDPEPTHNLIINLGKLIQRMPVYPSYNDERLQSNAFGLSFRNPVGLAAGFDKNAELIKLFYLLNFGFIEIGSVTAKPSKGNQKPRLFRLPRDEAIINRMGLNSNGANEIFQKLKRKSNYPNYPVGVNIAKTNDSTILEDKAIEDYLYTFNLLSNSSDYVVLNISCPNTNDGKTFEDPKYLGLLLSEVKSRNVKVPILVKLSPDIPRNNLEQLLEVCESYSINGYVVANTSSKRENLITSKKIINSFGNGGLSGKPIKKKSTEMIKLVYRLTHGNVPIIGVGGINSAESAYEKIKAGSSLVQVYTGLIYEGPELVRRINNGLVELLEKDGLKNISEAVGVN